VGMQSEVCEPTQQLVDSQHSEISRADTDKACRNATVQPHRYMI
jgi:hypothetical protein